MGGLPVRLRRTCQMVGGFTLPRGSQRSSCSGDLRLLLRELVFCTAESAFVGSLDVLCRRRVCSGPLRFVLLRMCCGSPPPAVLLLALPALPPHRVTLYRPTCGNAYVAPVGGHVTTVTPCDRGHVFRVWLPRPPPCQQYRDPVIPPNHCRRRCASRGSPADPLREARRPLLIMTVLCSSISFLLCLFAVIAADFVLVVF